MKRACVLVLAFHLVFIVQYAASETYKEWYENTVRNCTAGSTIKYYKPTMVCTCNQPGVIDSCKFLGVRDSSAIKLRGTSRTAGNGDGPLGRTADIGGPLGGTADIGDWRPKRPCISLALPVFDGCNWCGCDGGKQTCTKNPCLKKLKESTNIDVIVGSGTLNINTLGPEKCPAKRYQHEDGCNWCTCSNGWAFCTVMRCTKKTQEVNRCINNPDGGFYIEDGCNWCSCSPDNTALCTRVGCKKENKQSIQDMCIRHNVVRGFLSDDGCNRCSCTADNTDVICTRRRCKDIQQRKKRIKAKCTNNPKGGYFNDDGCNWCTCTPDKSDAICTDKTCNRDENKKPKKSRDSCKGKWFGAILSPDGCNTCTCLFGKVAACTIMYCPEPEETLLKKSRNPCKGKKMGRVLMPDGCNTCACLLGQATACTIMNCPEPVVSLTKKLSSSVCKNGSRHVKPDECNVCLCDNRGVAVCTVKYCPGKKTELNKNKQKKNIALLQGKKHNLANHSMKLYALKEKAQSCKVGEKFKQPYATCNWCTCIEDGVVTCDMDVCHGDSSEGEIN